MKPLIRNIGSTHHTPSCIDAARDGCLSSAASRRQEFLARRNRTSRRKTHKTEPAVAEPQGERPEIADRETPDKPFVMRRLFWPAVILVGIWWAVLIGLVVFTANPITLNRKQIHLSQRNGLIVTAQVLDPEKGKVKVLKDWTAGTTTGKELTVSGLKDLGVKSDQTYILPLTVSQQGTLRITPAAETKLPPPIYPADEESERQLQDLLKEWEPGVRK